MIRIRFFDLLMMICVLMFTFTGNPLISLRLNWTNTRALSNLAGVSSLSAVNLFAELESDTETNDNPTRINRYSLTSIPVVAAEYTARHYLAALDRANLLLSQDGSNPVVLALKGDILWKMHETLPAIEAWKRAGHYQQLVDAAKFLAREKQFLLAQSAWEAAVQVDPDDLRAWAGLGSMFWNQGDVGAAKRVFEAMVAKNSRSMGNLPYAYLGIIYAEQGLFDEANRVVEMGLALWPRDILIRTSQGIALARSGEETQAIVVLKQVLLDEPMNRDACYYLGWAYERQGDDLQAIHQYSLCLDRFPSDIYIRYGLGLAFTRQGRIAEACEQFLRILEIDPTFQGAEDRLRELGGMP